MYYYTWISQYWENFFYCTFFSTLALQKSFQILCMDDFHNINAIKTPSERILTNAVHMATLLLDVQPSVDAVPRPVDPTNIHRCVMVTIPGRAPQLYRGGISTSAVINEITAFWPDFSRNFFLESLPQPYKEINLCTMQQSLKELRQDIENACNYLANNPKNSFQRVPCDRRCTLVTESIFEHTKQYTG